jgi:hypothetical protein
LQKRKFSNDIHWTIPFGGAINAPAAFLLRQDLSPPLHGRTIAARAVDMIHPVAYARVASVANLRRVIRTGPVSLRSP